MQKIFFTTYSKISPVSLPSIYFFCSLASIVFTIFLTDVSTAMAKEMYIQSTKDIPVRRGQGTEYKIVAMAENGMHVDVLERTKNYARIRLSNGKDGWILRRFLSGTIPLEQLVEKLQVENKVLRERVNIAVKKEAESSASLEETQEQLNSVLSERNTLLEEYQQLQQDTTNIIQLKQNQEETARRNKQLTEEVVSLNDENVLLKKEKNLDWFITGAVVMAIGFLLGKMPTPRRKRNGYLS